MDFGQKLVCLLTAQGQNAPQAVITVAATLFSFTSLTLFLRSQHFKSLLRGVAPSVIFTQSITVN